MILTRVAVLVVLAFGIVAAPSAGGTQTRKIWRIGFLGFGTSSAARSSVEAFHRGLRELGYVEGHDVVIDFQWAEGRSERLPQLAAQLVQSNPDVIVTAGEELILAVRRATTTIPIVMAASADAVASGLVNSLARPGGNVTGLTASIPDLAGKQLELLREGVPKLSRVAVLWNPTNPGKVAQMEQARAAARSLRVALESVEVREANDFARAFTTTQTSRPDAMLVLADSLTVYHRVQIVEFLRTARLPALCQIREFVNLGCLMSYAPNLAEMYYRSASYVDRIFKGAKPANLPVEQPAKVELVLNMKTANVLGLTIPPSLLLRAAQVIE